MNKYEEEFMSITRQLLAEGFNPLEILKGFYEDKGLSVEYKGMRAAGPDEAKELDD